MTSQFAELHCHSHFSFKEGVSSVDQLAATAHYLGYRALALTDHDNLSGAMQFVQASKNRGFHGIVGSEFTMKGGHHLTVLAATVEGYSNICRLLSYSHVLAKERAKPELDQLTLAKHAEGLIVLSGCKKGEIPALIESEKLQYAHEALRKFVEIFGIDNFFIELQQNRVKGDTQRNRLLVDLAKRVGVGVVATNNAHYHIREYHQLQDCFVAIRHGKTLDETHLLRRPNSEFHMKSPQEMSYIFKDSPEAITNTVRIAERCVFDLTRDLRYRFPEYVAPEGYTPEAYLRKLCDEAARRRYGSIISQVSLRLDEEFRLIRKHNLSGFLLHYHDIAQLARKVMIRQGLLDPEAPLEEKPPGRGRGSSVAMLVGYLIGLSHIDPLQYDLSLERFLPEDLMPIALDIDLDFPRNIREELILAVHEEWGWDKAALVGMRSTYRIKGAIRDLGNVLDLPEAQVSKLASLVENTSAKNLASEMENLPEFSDKVRRSGWKDIIRLAAQMDGAPRGVSQHPGGMIISSRPLTDMVPIQNGAIDGRYVCQWDKDDIDAAAFVKIDFLALGTLSQLQEALQLIENRTGRAIDISRINFEDHLVYEMLWSADTIGIFQVESAAQMQTLRRIRPNSLVDMAHEVACVRPGVGVHDGIREYIARRSKGKPWSFDHPLEDRALKRTLGIILFQDQMNQLAMDIGGLSAFEADQMRRAFSKKRGNTETLKVFWEKFREGAAKNGVDEETTLKIFHKFNGQNMFPEAHAVAFGVTAYQMAWLKFYYPLEFMTSLFNQQPMGFWGIETLKEDAKRHGIMVRNPDVNLSLGQCAIEDDSIRLGFRGIANLGEVGVGVILEDRDANGSYLSLGEFMQRTRLRRNKVESLVNAGAFDSLQRDRRASLWEVGLRYYKASKQLALDFPVEDNMVSLVPLSECDQMTSEYKVLGMYPGGHVLEKLRSYLPKDVIASSDLSYYGDGEKVKIAGLVARPLQRPTSAAYFMSLEDEFGLISLIIWPGVYERFRQLLRDPLIMIEGTVSRRDGTMSVVVADVTIPIIPMYFPSKTHGLPQSLFR